ncbi:MAG: methyltransferase [Muribaculaceae bacterium]|nr:methyltransferase [Muribaculaceae bacterium]
MAREKIFRFKKFSVLNDKTAMKVGTDGVLLGAWCNVSEAKRVLDVGTGSGVIALMIAQRNNDATIYGIDIDGDSVEEARFNFKNSPWSDRLSAEMFDFNDFKAVLSYDLIVSNPPFFTNGRLPPNSSREQARHNTSLTFSQLISHSAELLSPRGVLAFIAPAENIDEIRRAVVVENFYVSRLAYVVPVEGDSPKRIMIEIGREDVATTAETIIIQSINHEFTPDYVNLTREFYLKM